MKISRRSFIKGMGAIGIATAIHKGANRNLISDLNKESVPNLDKSLFPKVVLEKYFTHFAQDELKNVDVFLGESIISGSIAVSLDTLVCKIFSPFVGYGFGGKIVYSDENLDKLKDYHIIHEYLHQADKKGLIDFNEFKEAFSELEKKADFFFNSVNNSLEDPAYVSKKEICKSDSFFSDMACENYLSEQIAFTGMYLVKDFKNKSPKYIHHPFRNVLKVSETRCKS